MIRLPGLIYLRILLTWLLVMQPMLAGFQAAQAANIPLSMELCRGGTAPSPDDPASRSDHAKCCFAACASQPLASGDASAKIAAPALLERVVSAVPQKATPQTRPELSAQAARAPPPNTPEA